MDPNLFSTLVAKDAQIGIVGLGYVGLPLACLLAQKFKVLGFDIRERRVQELTSGYDRTEEVEEKSKLTNPNLSYTSDPAALSKCALIIVAVPTPVDDFKVPDLSPMISASRTLGQVIAKGTVVVFESTVYPGVTEKVCAQHISEARGLVAGTDFHLGYSPERIVPGDKVRTLDKIVKIVAGSTPEVTNLLAEVYGSVISAGIYKAPSIMTAEAAKVIENTQRDLNIALVNELAMLFDRIGLDTLDVLEAAGTKWNFLPFRPGLVGGHCIDVDPHYLTHLATGLGFHTDVISSGRRINSEMAQFVSQKCLSLIVNSPQPPNGRLRVGILGVTFKENVPDVRNTKVVDLARSLESFGVETYLIDPVADAEDFEQEYKRKLTSWNDMPTCDAIILAVKHEAFMIEYPLERLGEKLNANKILLDLKGAFERKKAAQLGLQIWRM